MLYNFHMQIHHRRSIRLPDYDYTQPGYYFITLTADDGIPWFGEIEAGEMQLNTLGEMVQNEWLNLPQRFPGIALDEFVIMPNHFHGIIHITEEGQPNDKGPGTHEAFGRPVKASLPTMVRSFKAAVTLRARRMTGNNDLKLWRGNYYERVILDDRALLAARSYIQENPANWAGDEMNPERK